MSQVVERLELLHTATRQLAMAMVKDPQALGTMLDNLRIGFKLVGQFADWFQVSWTIYGLVSSIYVWCLENSRIRFADAESM